MTQVKHNQIYYGVRSQMSDNLIFLSAPSYKSMGHLYVLQDYVILVMCLRQNEISLLYLPYDCVFTLLHCVNSSSTTMFGPDDGLVQRKCRNMLSLI